MFLSTFEKPLDSKRRLLVPQDYRDAARTIDETCLEGLPPFDGLYCFESLDEDCLECGGAKLFTQYKTMIDGYGFATPARKRLEHSIYGAMLRLSFDGGGRVTLPDSLCQDFGLKDEVVLVGLYDRFQIWSPEKYRPYAQKMREEARALLLSRQSEA